MVSRVQFVISSPLASYPRRLPAPHRTFPRLKHMRLTLAHSPLDGLASPFVVILSIGRQAGK